MVDSVVSSPAAPVVLSPAPKKLPSNKKATAAAKGAASKKPSAAHPPISVMVTSAIKELKGRISSSLPAIKMKFLTAAVTSGAILQTKGHYKLAGAEAKLKIAFVVITNKLFEDHHQQFTMFTLAKMAYFELPESDLEYYKRTFEKRSNLEMASCCDLLHKVLTNKHCKFNLTMVRDCIIKIGHLDCIAVSNRYMKEKFPDINFKEANINDDEHFNNGFFLFF
ncbi:Winged helix-turn-helix DNA-binding domain,Linker histone H1/H5, domain H15 [Cinara cedri]|uniref:Winged helix-turn-helix DNA-binding domain,Linker histone H1/H5, domain H15 n=1 Tax=Cinara cedri TaxID=506608 RepID=A0A5E4MG60_9HEMI|nr:Winged helix-turn-helix DNA-binding domain,Linker histone H1/H5, domain H15 [Cinara cedri]